MKFENEILFGWIIRGRTQYRFSYSSYSAFNICREFLYFIAEYYRNHQHLQCMLNHRVHPRRRHKLKNQNFKIKIFKKFFVCFFDYVFSKQLIGFEWHEIYRFRLRCLGWNFTLHGLRVNIRFQTRADTLILDQPRAFFFW